MSFVRCVGLGDIGRLSVRAGLRIQLELGRVRLLRLLSSVRYVEMGVILLGTVRLRGRVGRRFTAYAEEG